MGQEKRVLQAHRCFDPGNLRFREAVKMRLQVAKVRAIDKVQLRTQRRASVSYLLSLRCRDWIASVEQDGNALELRDEIS